MKLKNGIFGAIVFLFAMFLTENANGQNCNTKKYKDATLKRLATGFTYRHTFEITPEVMSGKKEHTFKYILNRGTLYMVNMANDKGEEKGVIIEVYNQDNVMVGTNYDPRTGRFWPIGYACNQSGVHKVKVIIQDGTKPCAIALLGARK